MTEIFVPKDARIFIVEDNPERIAWFHSKLGSSIIGVYNQPSRAIEALKSISLSGLTGIFLDHDLGGPFMPPFSTDVAEYLVAQDPEIGSKVVIHSLNPGGAENLKSILPGSTWCPFGSFEIKRALEKT